MAHIIANQKKLLARVRRIKGQAESLEKSIGSENECINILQQIAAIRGAVNGLMSEVMEGHIREHLMNENETPAQREADMEEIVSVIRSYLK